MVCGRRMGIVSLFGGHGFRRLLSIPNSRGLLISRKPETSRLSPQQMIHAETVNFCDMMSSPVSNRISSNGWTISRA